MRIVPGSEPETELDALVSHLEATCPGAPRSRSNAPRRPPAFRCKTDGPGYAAARQALEDAYGKPVGDAGSGGSIPLLRKLQAAAPRAEFILWGPEDVAAARIHASDESVDPSEIEKMVVAQALLIQRMAEQRVTPPLGRPTPPIFSHTLPPPPLSRHFGSSTSEK